MRPICLALCLVLLLSGCTGGVFQERAQVEGTPQPILPHVPDTRNASSAMLFYRYLDEGYLACEPREISANRSNRLQFAEEVIGEWLKGPVNVELRPLCNGSTRLIAIREEGDTLNVTLSEDFLLPLERMPSNWEGVPQLRVEVAKDHESSVYALCATIIQMGVWSKVQIFIAQDASREGVRVTRGDLGFEIGGDMLLEPVSWSADMEGMILSPKVTLKVVLGACSAKDVKTLHKYLTRMERSGRTRPVENDLENFLNQSVAVNDSFSVSADSATISTDGQQATVIVTFDVTLVNGAVRRFNQQPIVLSRENQLWKLDFSILEWINELAQY